MVVEVVVSLVSMRIATWLVENSPLIEERMTIVTTAYVIITAYVIFNHLLDKKSTAYVITTACVIKI